MANQVNTNLPVNANFRPPGPYQGQYPQTGPPMGPMKGGPPQQGYMPNSPPGMMQPQGMQPLASTQGQRSYGDMQNQLPGGMYGQPGPPGPPGPPVSSVGSSGPYAPQTGMPPQMGGFPPRPPQTGGVPTSGFSSGMPRPPPHQQTGAQTPPRMAPPNMGPPVGIQPSAVNGFSSSQPMQGPRSSVGGMPSTHPPQVPMLNGPQPPQAMASMPRPPLPGQPYQRPTLGPPPSTNQPPRPGPPPTVGVTPPPMGNMSGQGDGRHGMASGPPPPPMYNNVSPASGRPNDLPVPYGGQGTYSHQLHTSSPGPGVTPNSSEPPSQKSSRAPSPVADPRYDALEGQFSPSSSGTGLSHMDQGYRGQQQHQHQQQPPQMSPQQMPPGPPQGYMPGSSPGQGVAQPSDGMPPGPGMPPPPMSTSASGGITGRRSYPQMPGYQQQVPPQQQQQQPLPPPQPQPGQGQQQMGQMPPMGGGSMMPPGGQMNQSQPYGGQYRDLSSSANSLSSSMGRMGLQQHLGEARTLNLLQERLLIPPEGVEMPKSSLSQDFKQVNCNSEIFRCTLNNMPQTQGLLNKSRLPLGILIHPFKDLSSLPVIQSSVIVRCRSCRTYINPYISFVNTRRWKCNLCFRVNELPEEFNYDPVSRTYGEPQRRPEIRSATIEFIAPSEYMLRPPQPAVYMYLLDVSFNARETGYLQIFCQTILEELDKIPGDARTQVGFLCFDRALYFFNLSEGLSRPQMMVVSDIEDVFLPSPESLLVNLRESKELISDLMDQLPGMFENNMETGNALGAALQAAYKLTSSTGGRVSVFQTQLPTVGPGALKNREDPNERAGKKVQNLGPATDFYKKLSLECSAQQVAVDMFFMNSQYADLASVGCISKYSGGCVHYYPGLHTVRNTVEADRFEGDLRRYLTRKIGFEAVMRIRCTRGLSIHTFHGNFFVRSTDLLSLPNINPDAGFGMQMSIEDTLNESNTVCFQAALLYTSCKGERRIRVHTLCLPVTTSLQEVYAGADQLAIIGLISKMAVDKALSTSLGDAREAFINAASDMLSAYGGTLTAAQRVGQLPSPPCIRLIPLYILALLKSTAFRVGSSTRLDDRVYALEQCKTQPLYNLLLAVHPALYPVHALDEKNGINKGDIVVPQPPVIQLCSGNLDRHGVYLLDAGTYMYLWIGAAVSDQFCRDVLEVPNFSSIPDGMTELPEVETTASELLRTFVNYQNEQKPFPSSFRIIREDSRMRTLFIQHMIEDRTESSLSYYEFLQHLQKEIKV